MNMYRCVLSNYLNLHADNPGNMSGIKVVIEDVILPYGNSYKIYRFYDLFSNIYLGGVSHQ